MAIIKGIDEEKYKIINKLSVRVPQHSEGVSRTILLTIGQRVLAVDPKYFRPTEVNSLVGDPTKANTKLGWIPEHDLVSLTQLSFIKTRYLEKENDF
jgi:GDP-D-mannose dehydratase